MSDDAQLIRRLQAGDLEALGELYDRHRLAVYRTALAVTRDSYRITVNLSYTWVTRRNKWRAPLEDFIDQLIGPVKYHPEPTAERNAELRVMQKAIDSLAFSQRVVIVLYYLNELNLQEIADILGCPVGTVKSRLHYGRENLRHLLEGNAPGAEIQYEFT
jgi:DNA-directed RNA polymerase specialized sigma24 family protein